MLLYYYFYVPVSAKHAVLPIPATKRAAALAVAAVPLLELLRAPRLALGGDADHLPALDGRGGGQRRRRSRRRRRGWRRRGGARRGRRGGDGQRVDARVGEAVVKEEAARLGVGKVGE